MNCSLKNLPICLLLNSLWVRQWRPTSTCRASYLPLPVYDHSIPSQQNRLAGRWQPCHSGNGSAFGCDITPPRSFSREGLASGLGVRNSNPRPSSASDFRVAFRWFSGQMAGGTRYGVSWLLVGVLHPVCRYGYLKVTGGAGSVLGLTDVVSVLGEWGRQTVGWTTSLGLTGVVSVLHEWGLQLAGWTTFLGLTWCQCCVSGADSNLHGQLLLGWLTRCQCCVSGVYSWLDGQFLMD